MGMDTTESIHMDPTIAVKRAPMTVVLGAGACRGSLGMIGCAAGCGCCGGAATAGSLRGSDGCWAALRGSVGICAGAAVDGAAEAGAADGCAADPVTALLGRASALSGGCADFCLGTSSLSWTASCRRRPHLRYLPAVDSYDIVTSQQKSKDSSFQACLQGVPGSGRTLLAWKMIVICSSDPLALAASSGAPYLMETSFFSSFRRTFSTVRVPFFWNFLIRSSTCIFVGSWCPCKI